MGIEHLSRVYVLDHVHRFDKTPFNPYSISNLAKNGWEKWMDVGVDGVCKQISKDLPSKTA